MTASQQQRYTVLFSIAFHAEMTERTIEVLVSELNMTMNWQQKAPSGLQAPGFAQLDPASGLYLLSADSGNPWVSGQDEWVLECRTFQPPHPDVVHGWQAVVRQAAHDVDAAVPASRHV